MKIAHYSEIEGKVLTGDRVKGATGRVAIGRADGAKNFCMRVFELAPGGHTPMHTHAWEHEIFVHEGSGEVYREGSWASITGGTIVFIPPDEEHQLRNSGESRLVFVCLIPAGFPEL